MLPPDIEMEGVQHVPEAGNMASRDLSRSTEKATPKSAATDRSVAMIEVPMEAFALLWAYEHTSSPLVPLHIRTHDDWPGKPSRGGRCKHLTTLLRPYAEKAWALMNDTGAA